jgi:uncharacterized protein
MAVVVALLAGLIFGAGLVVSRMVDPAKVLGFLDFAGIARGTWDPSLALVMAAALAISAPAFYWAQKRQRAVLAPFSLPTRRDLDARLIAGAALFGGGWGLVGFCPGPAIAALGFGAGKALIFFGAMIGGMVLYELVAAPPRGTEPIDQAA